MRTRGRTYPIRVEDNNNNGWFNQPPLKKKRMTGKAVFVTEICDKKQNNVSMPFQESSPIAAVATAASSADVTSSNCAMDALHDDLLISIMATVSATASSPADLINTMLTCRRFSTVAKHPFVLMNASSGALAVKASRWSDDSHRFLKQCADAGNVEACYTLGMIYFYCLQSRGLGASLMAKAAMESHAAALLSLAVIQFNGSGGARRDKDLRSGFTLCARSATLGFVDAVRELGHCWQDGYGVARNIAEGRRLLLEANAREAAAAVVASPRVFIETALQMSSRCNAANCQHHKNDNQTSDDQQKIDLIHRALLEQLAASSKQFGYASDGPSVYKLLEGGGCFLLSDFGCTVPPAKTHIANKFLVDWFYRHPPTSGLRLCSHSHCGRPETRKHEFRRCSACGTVNYCSRACQALDWKLRHKFNCNVMRAWDDWADQDDHDDEDDDDVQAMDDDREES